MNKYIPIQLVLFLCVFCACTNAQTNKLTSAKTEKHKGRMVYNINGERYYPIMYSAPYAKVRTPFTEDGAANYTNFTKAGFNLFEMTLYIRSIWKEDGTIDIEATNTELIDNLKGIYAINPNAFFQIRIMLNAPTWWHKKYPEELVNYARRDIDYKMGNEIANAPRASLASERWKKESTAILKQLLDYIQTTEVGNRVFSFMMCAGVYNEWHYYGFPEEPDTGIAMTNRFQQWLKDKYKTDAALQNAWNDKTVTIATATVPKLDERKKHPSGVFRNPQKERRIIDYFMNQHDAVERAIYEYTKYVKEYWPSDVLVGVFNGYFFYHKGGFNTGGHLAFDKILKNPYIDFIASPYSYAEAAREAGGTSQPRAVIESINLHNKLFMTEQDRMTHLPSRRTGITNLTNEAESIAAMRTNYAQMVNHATGYWLFDFGDIGNWNSPNMMADIKVQKEYCDKILNETYTSSADVAFIHDFKSFYYIAETDNPQSDELQVASATAMSTDAYKSGVAFNTYLLSDLERIDLDRYKVIVFGITYALTDAQMDYINTQVKKDGRTVVFTYASGITDGETLDVDRMEALTGFDMATLALNTPPEIALNNGTSFGLAGYFQGAGNALVDPLFEVKEEGVEVLGHYANTKSCAIARKQADDCTVIYAALPLRNPDFMRGVFKQAGAHIYSESNDVIVAGGGVICIAASKGTGGERTLLLKNGKKVTVHLEPGASKIIDEKTGEELF